MNKIQKFAFTLSIALAAVLTFSCSDSDDSQDNPSSDKISCIHQNLAEEANTLDDVGEACGASEDEVLAQLQPEIGTCDKNDLDFDKTIDEIMKECEASEIAIDTPSSSSQAQSSSSKTNSGNDNTSSSSSMIVAQSSSSSSSAINIVFPIEACYDNNIFYEHIHSDSVYNIKTVGTIIDEMIDNCDYTEIEALWKLEDVSGCNGSIPMDNARRYTISGFGSVCYRTPQ